MRLAALIVVIFVVIVLAIIYLPSRHVWTDDAYVTAHYTVVAPRVSGQVFTVDVDDNQPVHAGQVLATLDDRDYRTTLASAQATLARDKAMALDAAAAVTRQPALIDEQKANAAQIEARLAFARQNARRYTNLAQSGAGTTQEHQQSDAALRQLDADLQGANAQITAAQDQLAILRAQYQSALETIHLDEARVHQAELDLSYTKIRALMDGMVGEKSVQVGNYVAPGAALMALVPLDQIWIMANYRELALRHMRPGQHVRIHVDAYDITLDGIVDSVPPGSGAAFEPIAPENATGNFTKIVQRLPVKIVLAPKQPLARLLRLGMSVETTVDTGLADVAAHQNTTAGTVTAK
ncbi:major facilitator superfamily multidrug resistance transporter HlyD/EmrA/FusE [Gluconacetobacter sacchari DSM 12717]|nr:HlyD family secretion protein [Gluconacetobacter sacchari]GBQ29906.1 major facilitator superfamily multidrug resistance transporter HlyD/EmrA/FusE [Gluconacetobacter sacchari DSM 12717]